MTRERSVWIIVLFINDCEVARLGNALEFSRRFLRTMRPLLGIRLRLVTNPCLNGINEPLSIPIEQTKEEERGTMSGLNGTDQKVFDYYPRLKRLHQYVEQSYSEPISLGEAAGIAALESTYFSTYFRAKVGITFTEWLRQIRIKKAMELMKTRDSSITHIAYEVGFGDLRTFERAFKKHTRMTPLQFKKSLAA